MVHNRRIHQRFVAILLLLLLLLLLLPPPLVLLAALAAGRIRSNVTKGVRASLARVRQRLAGLDPNRQAIDARRLGLADSLGWYSDTIETLIRVEDVAADEVDNRGVARDLEVYTSLAQQAVYSKTDVTGIVALEVDEIGQVARARRSQGLVDPKLVPLIAANSSVLMSAAHLAGNR